MGNTFNNKKTKVTYNHKVHPSNTTTTNSLHPSIQHGGFKSLNQIPSYAAVAAGTASTRNIKLSCPVTTVPTSLPPPPYSAAYDDTPSHNTSYPTANTNPTANPDPLCTAVATDTASAGNIKSLHPVPTAPSPPPYSAKYDDTSSYPIAYPTQSIIPSHITSSTQKIGFKDGQDWVRIETEVETADGFKKLDLVIDHEQFVRLFMDPRIELMISDMSYLIGYKMVYVVDAYRKRIPNVIAIVTLKINNNNNAIFQSEGKHIKKDTYEMINLSKRIDQQNYYNRDSQAASLRHTGGDMIAWEHSTKFCAHNVETLALTFCGKFKEVITACHKYDTNMAFAESAYTYEENQEPVVYEVGVTNYSKHECPNIASGGCFDFFHFFLRPEYAMDYGFWQFQYADGKSDVNRSEIVLSKKITDLRRVTHKECYKGDFIRDRSKVKLVKTDKGYVSSQVMTNVEQDRDVNKSMEKVVDIMAQDLEKELKSTLPPVAQPTVVQPIITESADVQSTNIDHGTDDPQPETQQHIVVHHDFCSTQESLLNAEQNQFWHTDTPVNNQPDLATENIIQTY